MVCLPLCLPSLKSPPLLVTWHAWLPRENWFNSLTRKVVVVADRDTCSPWHRPGELWNVDQVPPLAFLYCTGGDNFPFLLLISGFLFLSLGNAEPVFEHMPPCQCCHKREHGGLPCFNLITRHGQPPHFQRTLKHQPCPGSTFRHNHDEVHLSCRCSGWAGCPACSLARSRRLKNAFSTWPVLTAPLDGTCSGLQRESKLTLSRGVRLRNLQQKDVSFSWWTLKHKVRQYRSYTHSLQRPLRRAMIAIVIDVVRRNDCGPVFPRRNKFPAYFCDNNTVYAVDASEEAVECLLWAFAATFMQPSVFRLLHKIVVQTMSIGWNSLLGRAQDFQKALGQRVVGVCCRHCHGKRTWTSNHFDVHKSLSHSAQTKR